MSGGHNSLRPALSRLSQEQQAVYIAASRDGLTYAQIAERMDITPVEVEQLLAKALVNLAKDPDL